MKWTALTRPSRHLRASLNVLNELEITMEIRFLLPDPNERPRHRLSGGDVEALLERTLAAPVVDPGQVPMHAPARLESGELRLALAVLEDALRCVLRHHDSPVEEQRLAAREALDWLGRDDDAPFTFVRICQLFELDPSWLRSAVRQRLSRGRRGGDVADRARHAA